MKKTLIVILLFILAPFLMLMPIAGAASAVSGFYDPDSGEDFDVETFGTSKVVQKVKGWYEEYISECTTALNERKKAVEREHTTIETVEKNRLQDEGNQLQTINIAGAVQVYKFDGSKFGEIAIDQPENKPSTKPKPTESLTDNKEDKESKSENSVQETHEPDVSLEPETEQREVCHVNVIITMDDFPLSAVLAYYNTLFAKYNSKLPEKDDIRDMLAGMTNYSEQEADDGSEDYYITMSFSPYSTLPDVIFSEWTLSDEERSEYIEMYLSMTELVSGWMGEEVANGIQQ